MELIYLATFLVALISSTLSGLAGGGGGFIMAPYWLISGMTPAQGATTGAFMALGMGGSSLAAFKGTGHIPRNKKLIMILLILTLFSSAVGPFFLQSIRAETFKPILAILTVVSLPLLFIKRKDRQLSRRRYMGGIAVLTLLLLASSFITSSAFSLLIAIVLTRSLGLTILQGTAMRRLMGIIQSVIIFIILVSLGNFVWQHAVVGLLGGSVGSYVGTRYAVTKGEMFAKYALLGGALLSSAALLIA
ncbi:MAG: TSUP family transporter [Candidatus Saccharibacteria bacterium]